MKIRKSGSVSEQPPVGTHLARLVSITDLGHQPGFEWQGKEVPSAYKLRLNYELVNSTNSEGNPFYLSEEITNSDNAKATMSMRLRTLGGTVDNVSAMLGKPCMVTVVENKNGYAKIDGQGGVGGVPAGFDVPQAKAETFLFDLDQPDVQRFNSFPEFLQERIKTNLDWEGSQAQAIIEAGV